MIYIKNKNHSVLFLLFACFLFIGQQHAGAQQIIMAAPSPHSISLGNALILVDEKESQTVHKAAMLLQEDIQTILGYQPNIKMKITKAKTVILIGSVTHSSYLKQLIRYKKINLSTIANKWEAYQIQVVRHPFAGIDQALIIAGSDRRGTAFGTLEISRQMGISPWQWWADVPASPKEDIYADTHKVIIDSPQVQYRGIFINDEAPAMSGWVQEKYGSFNHRFYAKVFELMLRLKANYIWPAMWGRSFYDDDRANRYTADTFGIVIGTSHHEPLMRAHDEWRRHGTGPWDYSTNADALIHFWQEGMQRATNEKIVTIGMRGDGDEPMAREAATSLLEKIVKKQREIIAESTGRPAEKTPQLWALYKEVQEYYDKGMRVPDDVTLLLCDDNWGNIRRLPALQAPTRSGGYGIYYHFDYVGYPRNYKWINTSPLPRIWEQMHLAWEYNARKIWIVNVGDIKPMEFPLSFFLDYAWNPEKTNADDLGQYTEQWCAQQFGGAQAKVIAPLLEKYAHYNGRRKPELLDEKTFSLNNYNELARVTASYIDLERKAVQIGNRLPAKLDAAYYQLVLHPIKAMANLYKMYYYTALNHQAFRNNSPNANVYADSVEYFYVGDSLLTLQYHRINNGKWNHFMSQTHIGYTYWQQPEHNKMPEIYRIPQGQHTAPLPVPDIYTLRENSLSRTGGACLFSETNGYLSMEAAHFSLNKPGQNAYWKVIPGLSRTMAGVTMFPVTALAQTVGNGAPVLQYDFHSQSKTTPRVYVYLAPTLNFQHTATGLRYAIAIDDEAPQVISINRDEADTQTWENWVANNTILKKSLHAPLQGTNHTIKIWAIDPGVVVQKIVVDLGGLKESYLGPEETIVKTTAIK